jgi:hypothetical protein
MLWIRARFEPAAATGLDATYGFSVDDDRFVVRRPDRRLAPAGAGHPLIYHPGV